jgi:KaiC/GvpD/RAD55 family RecA-like ATPase
MNKIKLTTGIEFMDLIQSGGYAVGELGLIMSPPSQPKTNTTTTCVCHMVREMGDCDLNEVVKQVLKNKLW